MRMRIDDIATIQIGYQFREKLTMASDGTHQVIQVKDIDEHNDHRLVPSSLYRVTPKRDAEKYEVTNGDVLFLSKGRRNYATLIDGLIEDYPWIKPDGSRDTFSVKTIAASYFYTLKPKSDRVRPEYLAWAINAPPAQAYLQSMASGSAMPFIPKHSLIEMEIDVPDLDTQRSIVQLHALSLREGWLLKRLEQRRSDLVTGVCLAAARQRPTRNKD